MLVVALVYIDRFCGLTGRELSPKNVHRIFLTAYLCAVKFHEDRFYRNTYYAQAGGLHIKELNNLERLFLKRVDFALTVQPNIYNEYLRAIMTVNQAEKVPAGLECVEEVHDTLSKKEVRRSHSDASTTIGTTASEISSSDDTSNRNLYTPQSRSTHRGSYGSRFCNEDDSSDGRLDVVREEEEHDIDDSDDESFLQDEIDQHGIDAIDAFHDSDHDSGSESDASFNSHSGFESDSEEEEDAEVGFERDLHDISEGDEEDDDALDLDVEEILSK